MKGKVEANWVKCYRVDADAKLVLERYPFLKQDPMTSPFISDDHSRIGSVYGDRRRQNFCTFPNKILDHLYLGNVQSAQNIHLKSLGIFYVVNATNCSNTNFFSESPDFSYLNVNIFDLDGELISSHFDKVVEFIEKASKEGKKCLVHCAAGISRSSSLVLAYLMKSQKMSLKEAYLFVKSKRNIICPNHGFIFQLVDYEVQLFGKHSLNRDLEKSGYYTLDELC